MSKNSRLLLANHLKEKRVAAGLSQKFVSDKLGYSTSQFVSNWERGKSHPPIAVLRTLAALYRIPAEDLFEVLLKQFVQDLKVDLKKKFVESMK